MSRNKPRLGEVVGDNLMDLYYQRMHGIYAAESHIYKKGVPHDFSKLMKAYLFLSVHPKFDIKITIDGSKPPSKNPTSMASEEFVKGKICEDLNLSFIRSCPYLEIFHPSIVP